MPLQYTIPEDLDTKTIVNSLISFLGVVFIACISISFVNLFNQKIELIMLVSFCALMIIFFLVSFGVANLFTEMPNLALVKIILIFSISGLVIVIISEYSPEVFQNTGTLVLIIVIGFMFAVMTIFAIVNAETKKRIGRILMRIFCCTRENEGHEDEDDQRNRGEESTTVAQGDIDGHDLADPLLPRPPV